MKLRDLGEFGLLEALGLFRSPLPPGWVGPGDDAAVLPPPEGRLLVTADLLMEDVHFRLATTSARDLGYKAVAVNVSDVAAMGGRPQGFVLSASLRPDLDVAWVRELYAGLREAADAFSCPLVGGDTTAGPRVCLSVAVTGSAPAPGPVLRSGARPGHDLFVTGTPGESAAALRALEAGRPAAGELLRRHRRPTPRVALGARLGEEGLAAAMIDVSDGLLQDLSHVLAASGVGAEVWAERLPVSAPLARAAHEEGADPLDLLLCGGEDYELLFAAPPAHRPRVFAAARQTGTPVRRAGSFGGSGLRLTRAGRPLPLPACLGFDHFGGG